MNNDDKNLQNDIQRVADSGGEVNFDKDKSIKFNKDRKIVDIKGLSPKKLSEICQQIYMDPVWSLFKDPICPLNYNEINNDDNYLENATISFSIDPVYNGEEDKFVLAGENTILKFQFKDKYIEFKNDKIVEIQDLTLDELSKICSNEIYNKYFSVLDKDGINGDKNLTKATISLDNNTLTFKLNEDRYIKSENNKIVEIQDLTLDEYICFDGTFEDHLSVLNKDEITKDTSEFKNATISLDNNILTFKLDENKYIKFENDKIVEIQGGLTFAELSNICFNDIFENHLSVLNKGEISKICSDEIFKDHFQRFILAESEITKYENLTKATISLDNNTLTFKLNETKYIKFENDKIVEIQGFTLDDLSYIVNTNMLNTFIKDNNAYIHLHYRLEYKNSILNAFDNNNVLVYSTDPNELQNNNSPITVVSDKYIPDNVFNSHYINLAFEDISFDTGSQYNQAVYTEKYIRDNTTTISSFITELNNVDEHNYINLQNKQKEAGRRLQLNSNLYNDVKNLLGGWEFYCQGGKIMSDYVAVNKKTRQACSFQFRRARTAGSVVDEIKAMLKAADKLYKGVNIYEQEGGDTYTSEAYWKKKIRKLTDKKLDENQNNGVKNK